MNSAQRYHKSCKTDEVALRSDIIGLATKYGRYGYRPFATLRIVLIFSI